MQIQRLQPGVRPRHQHRRGYAALVLSGSYEEAGDTGRWKAQAGDIVYHRAFEAHRNIVEMPSAVVNFALPDFLQLPPVFTVERPDALFSAISTNDEGFLSHLAPVKVEQALISDWPDLLANDLRKNRVHLGAWAAAKGLRPETITRGFRRIYGTSPARYRKRVQTLAAIDLIVNGADGLANIASTAGFSDQAHMSRAVAALTGHPPAKLRKVNSVQDQL